MRHAARLPPPPIFDDRRLVQLIAFRKNMKMIKNMKNIEYEQYAKYDNYKKWKNETWNMFNDSEICVDDF